MKIVLTGGGTGGHVIPNISLLPYLEKHFGEICYIGSNGIEKQIVKEHKGINFYEIESVKLDKEHKLKNLLLPIKLLKVVKSAGSMLDEIKPDIVFSKGGYVSLPVCFAAYFRKIPIVSHESDLSLGRANKIIYRLSRAFCTTFEKTKEGLKKGVYTGAPIREELKKGDKAKGIEITKLTRPRPYVLFIGGSTGASFINEVVFSAVQELTKKYNVIHIVGKNKGKKIECDNYYQAEYSNEIEHLFALSDIVISRAGSGVIYELLSLNKKMLLIPLPKSKSSRGDQVENAKYFKEAYGASVIFQEKLTPRLLEEEIDRLYNSSSNYKVSKENESLAFLGAANIVNVILDTVKKNKK